MALPDHGTHRRYGKGCRCRRCKAAWAVYMRDYKQRTGRSLSGVLRAADREIARAEALLATIASGDDDVAIAARLAPLDYQILTAIQRRTRQRRGDVIGRLLREHGPALVTAPA